MTVSALTCLGVSVLDKVPWNTVCQLRGGRQPRDISRFQIDFPLFHRRHENETWVIVREISTVIVSVALRESTRECELKYGVFSVLASRHALPVKKKFVEHRYFSQRIVSGEVVGSASIGFRNMLTLAMVWLLCADKTSPGV